MEAEREHAQHTTDPWTSLGGVLLAAVLLWTVLWLALAVLVPTVALGFRPHAIVSGSMEPAIRAGDVVLTATVDHPVEPGRVITFTDPNRADRLITHRVVTVGEDGHYRTRGDANEAVDSTPVPPENVQGEGRLLVPLAGMPLLWSSRQPFLLLGLLVATVVAAVAVVGPRAAARPTEHVGTPAGVTS